MSVHMYVLSSYVRLSSFFFFFFYNIICESDFGVKLLLLVRAVLMHNVKVLQQIQLVFKSAIYFSRYSVMQC